MTILGVLGIPRGPLGDFSGRSDGTGIKGSGPFTRLGVTGIPRGPLGDFSGRGEAQVGARPGGPFTRLGVTGIPRGPLGDFSGRTEAPVGQIVDVPTASLALTVRQPDVLQGQIVDFVGAALVYYPMEPFIDQGRAVLPDTVTLELVALEPAIESDSSSPLDNYVDVQAPAILSLLALEPGAGGDVATAAPDVITLALTALQPAINMGQAILVDPATLGIAVLQPTVSVERILDVANVAQVGPLVLTPRVEQEALGDMIIDVLPDVGSSLVGLEPSIEVGAPPGALHLRQQIRQAAALIMREQVSLAASRVFESRVYAVDASAGPYVLVYTTTDVIEAASLDDPPIQRRLITLVIEAVAQAADDLDDVLDALTLQIEQAMATPTGRTLNGLAAGSELISLDFEMVSGAQPVGVSRITYDVTAYSMANTPQTAIN